MYDDFFAHADTYMPWYFAYFYFDFSNNRMYINRMASCKIIIYDEVNCKVEGLDVDVRRRLSAKFKYDVPYARYLPAVRLGRWDGKVAYFQLSGSTYVNLLPDIIEWLTERNIAIELDDQRAPAPNFDFSAVAEDSYSAWKWPKGHERAGDSIMLRDYQVEIVNNFLSNPQALQEVATGAGKTLMTAVLSHKCEPYGRTLVIVPNKSLVTQTEADYINMGLDVGVYFGDRKDYGKTHTICTWQSLNNIIKKEKETELTMADFIENVIAVIVDECFDGDTLVNTSSGKIPIKEIKAGDKVINFCEESKSFKEDIVVKVHKNLTNSHSEKMLELNFDSGQTIKVTANHKFLTNEGWVRADELTGDMEIININTYS